MHGYEKLGGIAKGRKRTYRVDVDIQQPSAGEIRIDPVYEVSVFDNDTGELVRKELPIEVSGDSRSILSDFVNAIKHSAENDFA
jgi:hypothetical protein